MIQLRRLRLLASLISLLFLAATMAYAAHHHEGADQSRAAAHCDLCLQFGAAAGVPAAPALLQAAAATVYRLPVNDDGVNPGRQFLQSLQARAPPESLHG